MISWKRINLFFGLILFLGSLQVTYSTLKPIYVETGLNEILSMSIKAYVFVAILHLTLVILYFMFGNKLKLIKQSMYVLIGPILSLPLLVLIFESSIGFTLFAVYFVSLLLQRINWKYVNSIIEDLKLSFYPHLKNGFNEFLDTREQRKHDMKN